MLRISIQNKPLQQVRGTKSKAHFDAPDDGKQLNFDGKLSSPCHLAIGCSIGKRIREFDINKPECASVFQSYQACWSSLTEHHNRTLDSASRETIGKTCSLLGRPKKKITKRLYRRGVVRVKPAKNIVKHKRI